MPVVVTQRRQKPDDALPKASAYMILHYIITSPPAFYSPTVSPRSRGRRRSSSGDRAILSSSLKRQRMLEQRLAESEDSRIGAEVEAGRLQAFFDEMTGLGSSTVR